MTAMITVAKVGRQGYISSVYYSVLIRITFLHRILQDIGLLARRPDFHHLSHNSDEWLSLISPIFAHPYKPNQPEYTTFKQLFIFKLPIKTTAGQD